MVSFSCENCGDVLTKKKLDQHYNRCHGQFTCIDCMTTFAGTSYRSHTSCITEDQKYQGALYKEKPSKNKKSVSIVEPRERQMRQPYIEDVPDQDDSPSSNAVALLNAPPTSPSPPPSAGAVVKVAEKPNVFDFLVNEETPNASRANLGEPMQMVAHAPPVFRSHSNSPPSSAGHDQEHRAVAYEESIVSNGYAYDARPVSSSKAVDLYRTPAPKESRRRHESPSRYAPEVVTSSMRKSTDKKRKRQVEDLDLSQAQQYHNAVAMEIDDPNFVPVPLQHSGLTGGLSRMLSKTGRAELPPSPAYSVSHDDKENDSGYSDVDETPLHPVKTRRDREHRSKDAGKEKDRDARRGRPSASNSNAAAASGALVKVRRTRRTSDESRPRKHHRSHRHRSDEHPDRDRHRRVSGDSEVRRRKPKAIEWRGHSDDEHDYYDDTANGQMVLYADEGRRADRERRASSSKPSKAEWFLSYVTKGPDSEKGYSINKALKRYHRERLGETPGGKREERDRDRIEDEKELWKSLRLKRNDRGEIVVFILEGED